MSVYQLSTKAERILTVLKRITGKKNVKQVAEALDLSAWAVHKWLHDECVPMKRVVMLAKTYPDQFNKSELNSTFE